VLKTDNAQYVKHKEPENCVLAIRPMQVVLASAIEKKTFKIINYS
jgi:hypothetical protein